MSGRDLARLCARHLEGRVAAISFQSVGELWYGAIKDRWGDRKTRVLTDRIGRFVVLAYDEATVRAWAELKAEAEEAGLPKNAADLWIAATAKRHELPLLTNDRGFLEALDIRVVKPDDPPISSAWSTHRDDREDLIRVAPPSRPEPGGGRLSSWMTRSSWPRRKQP